MGSEISHDEASRLVSNGDKVKINKYINQQRAVSARLAACEEALKFLIDTIDAHETICRSCDRDGKMTCYCLDRATDKARAALKEPRRG